MRERVRAPAPRPLATLDLAAEEVPGPYERSLRIAGFEEEAFEGQRSRAVALLAVAQRSSLSAPATRFASQLATICSPTCSESAWPVGDWPGVRSFTQPIYDAAAGNVTGDLREESNEMTSDHLGCVLLKKVSGRRN